MDPSPNPPLYGREYNVLPMWPRVGCTAPPPSQGGLGWVFLHARLNTESGRQRREDGDYDVEDLAPSAVVVECSHSGKID